MRELSPHPAVAQALRDLQVSCRLTGIWARVFPESAEAVVARP